MIPEIDSVIIENVSPCIENGRYPVKRVTGTTFHVKADIFSHGHEVIRAVLLYKIEGDPQWSEKEMIPLENHCWEGSFELKENKAYQYMILSWRELFLSWAQDMEKKYAAGFDVTSEILEGKKIVEAVLPSATKEDKKRLAQILLFFEKEISPVKTKEDILKLIQKIEKKLKKQETVDQDLSQIKTLLEGEELERKTLSQNGNPIKDIILGEELAALMAKYSDRGECGRSTPVLEVIADRREAEYASWYEMWPRSQGTVEGESATFDDMILRLPEIKRMGFHVVYLPPIHPIGETNRKGPNNSLICPPGSPGCPYAIGNKHGGHMAIDPELGNMDGFIRFEKECRKLGMEVAMDLALQTSPDHPWVKSHPEWFIHRPDGTIKFAENPPKKYEDIYPLNFNTKNREGLWMEIQKVIRFWMDKGVRIFRVDNPHTKPVKFWEWLIGEIQKTDPDVLFLSEAFTHPKMMKALAKSGFTQSYTYFTWRNFKHELEDYHIELTQTEAAEFMRGNLFVNTPDILPAMLQNAPRSAFKIRATLAATLSSVWGMYNGFELCEGDPVPGKEEYNNSEKYDYKVWDWNRAGNIKNYIAQLNRIREEEPALQLYRNLQFYQADNDNILFYGKHTPDYSSLILVIINLDPYRKQEAMVHFPVHQFKISEDESFQVLDMVSGKRFYWKGATNFISLDPGNEVAHILKIMKWSHNEQDYDYFIK